MIKKFTLIFAIFTFFIGQNTAFAGEGCLQDPIYERDYNAEVVSAVFFRSIPCMTGSEILATLPKGEIVNVIAVTDGWTKVRRSDSSEGWVGEQFLAQTDKPFNSREETAPPASNDPLYDISGHPNETAIWALYNLGIISGNPDGSFRPDNPLNRAELVKLLIEATVPDFGSVKSSYDSDCFPDITEGQWYTPYVCYSKTNNIVEGYPDNTFRPGRNISKIEAVKVILESYEIEIPENAERNAFSDTDIEEWYAPYLEVAADLNLLEEEEGTSFYPGANILRGAVSHIIYEAYKYALPSSI
jgi:hypothetical protein